MGWAGESREGGAIVMLMPLLSSASLSHRRCRASCALVSEVAGKNSEWWVDYLSVKAAGRERNLFADAVKHL